MHCQTRATRARPEVRIRHAGEGGGPGETAARGIRDTWLGHFSISIGREGDADVVALRGELDIAGTGPLHECLARLAGRDVVVDVRRLSFIDAGGMSVLVVAHGRARRQGRSLVVRGACREVRRVLDIGGLSHLLCDRFEVTDAVH